MAELLPTKFTPFRHLAYINKLRAQLSQPLIYNLSDSCAETYTVGELLAMDDNYKFKDIPLNYAPLQGSEAMRATIATLHQPLNTNEINAHQVITYSGAQEAIFGVFNALLAPNDEVICFTPNYPSLTELPKQLGAKVIEIPLKFEQNWQFNIQTLKNVINDKTKLIVINSPHNPTGALLTHPQAQELIALASQNGLYILADEVSVFSDYYQLNLNYGFLDYPRTVSISVMSKSFGLAGVRVGWAICKDDALRQKLLDIKGYGSICGSASDDAIATIAINNHQQIFSRNNEQIRDNISLFEQLVASSDGKLQWHAPKAGIMSVVKVGDGLDVDKLALDLAKQHQTLMLPGHLFGIEGNYFRLGLGKANFKTCLEGLEALING